MRHVLSPLTHLLGGTRAGACAVLAAHLIAILLITGCSAPPKVTPAAFASDPACASALEAAPATVLDHDRRTVDGLGAVGWGEPVIVLRCGLPELGASTLRCLSVNDVEWVIDTDSEPMTAASYGTRPTVELAMPQSYGTPSLAAALVDVAAIAQALPRGEHRCS